MDYSAKKRQNFAFLPIFFKFSGCHVEELLFCEFEKRHLNVANTPIVTVYSFAQLCDTIPTGVGELTSMDKITCLKRWQNDEKLSWSHD